MMGTSYYSKHEQHLHANINTFFFSLILQSFFFGSINKCQANFSLFIT